MKSNEGHKDRAIRFFLGVAISSFFIYHNSPWAALGFIPILTAIIGVCPLYTILGINTKKNESLTN